MVEYESKRRKYLAYYQSKKDIQMDNMVEVQNIPLPDNIPLPKEKPPKLNTEDTHESTISLVSLPSNVAPPPAPSGLCRAFYRVYLFLRCLILVIQQLYGQWQEKKDSNIETLKYQASDGHELIMQM